MNCRSCGSPIEKPFLSVGPSPLANSYVKVERQTAPEATWPLDVHFCEKCYLVQLPVYEQAENIFSDYSYFSSYSTSWLEHCRLYAEEIITQRKLNGGSFVVELASNDGYLLKNFVARKIPVLGVEPAENVARVAREKGVDTDVAFFGAETATRIQKTRGSADLIMGNNVLAHVPDVNDFVAGVKILLKPEGIATFEFPHLLQMVEQNQFDTIYHEHFSYFSLHAVQTIMDRHGLQVVDVKELPTHGGSLRLYCAHAESGSPVSAAVKDVLMREKEKGVLSERFYHEFAERVVNLKFSLLKTLMDLKSKGLRVVGYGAPAKGNTLLNYCGVRTEFLDYTVDRSPAKQGHLLPGTRIPILGPDQILKDKPDIIFILPWNLKSEISEQMKEVRAWGGRFMVAVPEPTIF